VYVNTMDTEIKLVQEEIDKEVKAIENKEDKISELYKRLNKLVVVRTSLLVNTEPDPSEEAL